MATGWGTDLEHACEPLDVARSKIGDGTHYVVIGRPESGYSQKVRAAMILKGVPHAWIDRNLKSRAVFEAHARVRLIPLVFRPDGSVLQDSTPILEHLEAAFPTPSLHPADGTLRFLSFVLEEFGDEWVDKLMFHRRWRGPEDRIARSTTLARGMLEGHWAAPFAPILRHLVVRRMVPRMALAGSNDNNAPILEASFARTVALLDAHLASRAYLFGGRPAFGDFGVWAQLHQAWMDPTGHAHLEAKTPALVAWLTRMKAPTVEGAFESFAELEPTLRPLFAGEVGPHYLAWALANERAEAVGSPRTELEMEGRLYYQRTFQYPARTLEVLRRRAPANAEPLRTFLAETGCLGAIEKPRRG